MQVEMKGSRQDLAARRFWSRAQRAGLLLGLALGLSGCTGLEPGLALFTGATATTINSDRLPTDLLAEYVTGMSCSSPRQSRDGGPLCRPHDQSVIEKPKYCYRSIAAVTCYDEPDPYRDGAREVQ